MQIPYHCLFFLSVLAALFSCTGTTKVNTRAEGAATSSVTITRVSPVAAKPGDKVSLSGQSFSLGVELVVPIALANGSVENISVRTLSDTSAEFVMPEGVKSELKDLHLQLGAAKVGAFRLFAEDADNEMMIVIGEASRVCSTETYIDRNGEKQRGKKDCATGAISECDEDGASDCHVKGRFKAADMSVALPGNIRSSVTIAGIPGSVTVSPSNCSSAGQQSCVAVGTYFAGTACAANGSACYLPTYALSTQPLKAISYDAIDAGKASIRSSLSLGGVTGTLADCTSNGAQGCVTTATYKSGDLTNLSAGNIKSGVTIAGLPGDYPSATYPLTGASVTADLDAATFNAKVKSATAFEYWTSSGSRQTGAGDADIIAENISSGLDIFGSTGLLVGGAPPDPWDVRLGISVSGVTGKLYVNCRNRVLSSVYNYDGPVTAITNSYDSAGATLDYWDTIDDYNAGNAGLPTGVVSGWAGYDCSGVESSAGDAKVWKDVTTAGSGAASCTGSPERCTMKDKITGLDWSKQPVFSYANSITVSGSTSLTISSTTGLLPNIIVSGTGIPVNTYIVSVDSGTQITMSANATASNSNVLVTAKNFLWNGAINYCDSLSHNGATDWRLPTQKELMEAYNHGIRSAASSNWINESNMNAYYWSATTVSFQQTGAWSVVPSNGQTFFNNSYANKANNYQVTCVR